MSRPRENPKVLKKFAAHAIFKKVFSGQMTHFRHGFNGTFSKWSIFNFFKNCIGRNFFENFTWVSLGVLIKTLRLSFRLSNLVVWEPQKFSTIRKYLVWLFFGLFEKAKNMPFQKGDQQAFPERRSACLSRRPHKHPFPKWLLNTFSETIRLSEKPFFGAFRYEFITKSLNFGFSKSH